MLSTALRTSLKATRSFSTSRAALDVSRVTLVGRLGADPVLRETSTGKPYYVYSVATSIGIPTADEAGNRVDPPTSWHNVFAFNEGSHKTLARVGKGSTVFVEADFEMRPGGAAADGSALPDKPLLKHRTMNVINRLKPQTDAEESAEDEE